MRARKKKNKIKWNNIKEGHPSRDQPDEKYNFEVHNELAYRKRGEFLLNFWLNFDETFIWSIVARPSSYTYIEYELHFSLLFFFFSERRFGNWPKLRLNSFPSREPQRFINNASIKIQSKKYIYIYIKVKFRGHETSFARAVNFQFKSSIGYQLSKVFQTNQRYAYIYMLYHESFI